MVNVTVIKGKDILKYGIKIGLSISLLFVMEKTLTMTKDKIKISSIINKEKLESCIESNIPLIKQVNKEESPQIKEINPLEYILSNQLSVTKYIKKEKKEEIDKEENKIINEENKKEDNNEEQNIEEVPTNIETHVVESSVPNKFTNAYKDVQIKNETKYNLTDEMLVPDIELTNKNILIFHTHTCESYTPTEKYNYEQTGTYRTTDLNYSVVKVGDELTNRLRNYEYNVIHNTTYHDFPAYSGSYGRSLTTVQNLLQENKDVDIIIDLHRDAIGDYSYAPTVKIGDEEAARLMFVIGTDGGGLEHSNWNQNLKSAIKLQEKANELYPGLFKPIILRNSRYNQQLAKGACIIEVGATGNTLEQCLNSMKYLAKVINEVIK